MNLNLRSHWYRAHGLGNDYLVFEAAPGGTPGAWPMSPETVAQVCHRTEGVGSDGIVALLEREPADGIFPLRMFNPDGSEFERSGNGLRILGAYLLRAGLVAGPRFSVRSGGSVIALEVHGPDVGVADALAPRPEGGTFESGTFDLSVEMGRARLGPSVLNWVGAFAREGADLEESGRARLIPEAEVQVVTHPELGPLRLLGVSVGNPHAVVLGPEGGFWPDDLDLDGPRLRSVGPFLATHPSIPHGTNVQLVRRHPTHGLEIGIWERGVGRTSASGTSSCAATVALVALGLLPAGAHRVCMPGGQMQVTVTPEMDVTLRGPVQEITSGQLARGFTERLRSAPGS